MHENTDKFQLFSLPLSGHPAPATTEKNQQTPTAGTCHQSYSQLFLPQLRGQTGTAT